MKTRITFIVDIAAMRAIEITLIFLLTVHAKPADNSVVCNHEKLFYDKCGQSIRPLQPDNLARYVRMKYTIYMCGPLEHEHY